MYPDPKTSFTVNYRILLKRRNSKILSDPRKLDPSTGRQAIAGRRTSIFFWLCIWKCLNYPSHINKCVILHLRTTRERVSKLDLSLCVRGSFITSIKSMPAIVQTSLYLDRHVGFDVLFVPFDRLSYRGYSYLSNGALFSAGEGRCQCTILPLRMLREQLHAGGSF